MKLCNHNEGFSSIQTCRLITMLLLLLMILIPCLSAYTDEDLKNPRFCQKVVHLDCELNSSYVDLTCAYEKKFDAILYNIDADIKTPLDNIVVQFEVSAEVKGSKTVLANRSIDLCEVFRGRSSDLYSFLITGFLTRSPTMPSTCPIPTMKFFAHDFLMDDHKFPPVFFNGKIFIKVKVFVGDQRKHLRYIGRAFFELVIKLKRKKQKCKF